MFPEGNTAPVAVNFPYTALGLSNAVDILPNQWGLLGDQDIFEDVGHDATMVEIRYRDGFIDLLGSAERGSMPQATDGDEESEKIFKIPHFPTIDNITPKDLQDRFAFVPGDNIQRRRRTVEDEMMRRLEKIKLKHDLLREWLRMCALKGVIIDGRNKTLYNYFTNFGVTQQVFNFNFYDDTFAVREFTYEISRYIELNLHGDVSNGVKILVDPVFFSALTSHPNVKGFYLQNPSAPSFQGDLRKNFTFGSVTFVEYNAQVPTTPLTGPMQQQTDRQDGVTPFIESGVGYAYPEGTRETFRIYDAPPYNVNMLDQLGMPLFISPKILDHGMGVELFSQSNPLAICRRPNLLAKCVAVTVDPD